MLKHAYYFHLKERDILSDAGLTLLTAAPKPAAGAGTAVRVW